MSFINAKCITLFGAEILCIFGVLCHAQFVAPFDFTGRLSVKVTWLTFFWGIFLLPISYYYAQFHIFSGIQRISKEGKVSASSHITGASSSDAAAFKIQRFFRERFLRKSIIWELWTQQMMTVTGVAAVAHTLRELTRLMLLDFPFTCSFISGVDVESCRPDSLAFISRALTSSEIVLSKIAYLMSGIVLIANVISLVVSVNQYFRPQLDKIATTDLLTLASTDDTLQNERENNVTTTMEYIGEVYTDEGNTAPIIQEEGSIDHVEKALGFRRKVGNRQKVILKRQTSLLLRAVKPPPVQTWGEPEIEGFLLKKSSGKIFHSPSTFQKRYFIASDNVLRYYRRDDRTTNDDLLAVIDLDRVDIESPTGDTVILRLDGGYLQLKVGSESSEVESARIARAWYESLTNLQWRSQFRHGSRMGSEDR
jgi:hypothetical protein